MSIGQFLLALEPYPLDAEALAARFGRPVLVDIQASVPLEPRPAARVGAVLMVPNGGEKAWGWWVHHPTANTRNSSPR